MSFLMARHSPVWITNDSIHCSLPSNYQNLQKVGYDTVVFNVNVLGHARVMQKWYQWKEDELLFTYRSHANIQINWL